MEFKVNSKQLEKLLSKVYPVVPSRSPMTILENFLFDIKDGMLTIAATDIDISLMSYINTVTEDNLRIVVPAKLLFETIKSLGDTTINFNVQKNGKLVLKTETGEYILSYLDPDSFPEIVDIKKYQEEEEVFELTIPANDLLSSISKASFAMSKEEVRPAMTGMLFQLTETGMRFVATDGHRLVRVINTSLKNATPNQYILPEKAIAILQKIVEDKDVRIIFTKSHAAFLSSDIQLVTRLIGQKYPDYESVIPLENEFKLKIKTKELSQTIKRMILYSSNNITRKVKFSITQNNVEVSAEDQDMGASAKENIPCEFSGETMEIGFNTGYLNDILQHVSGEDEIIFRLNSPTKAAIIEPVKESEKENYLMLLMPVRLNT